MYFHLNQKTKNIHSIDINERQFIGICRVHQVKNISSPIRFIQCLSDPHCSKLTVGIVLEVTNAKSNEVAMAEWLCCLVRTIEVVCPNLGATRHRMTLDKPLNVFLDY